MKYHILIFAVIIATLSAFTPVAGPVMKFDETKHNFGFIRQGDIVSHEYTFTNTGDAPLIISECEVTCECTKVDFPKTPIAPKGTGTVKVTFDSKSAIDRQDRDVIVKSNAPTATISFKCVVLKPKN